MMVAVAEASTGPSDPFAELAEALRFLENDQRAGPGDYSEIKPSARQQQWRNAWNSLAALGERRKIKSAAMAIVVERYLRRVFLVLGQFHSLVYHDRQQVPRGIEI